MSGASDPTTSDQPSRLERAMFAPVPLWSLLLLFAVGLLGLIGFGFLVLSGAQKTHGQSGMEKLAMSIASVPVTLKQAVAASNPFSAPPGKVEKLDAGLWRNPDKSFVDPGYLLVSHYSPKDNRSIVEIIRLSDGKVMHTYLPDVAEINRQTTIKSPFLDVARDKSVTRYQPFHPLLTANGDLVFNGASAPLVRVDACGKVRWVTQGIFSHSLEAAPDGGFWSPMTLAKSKRPGASPEFREDAIVHVGDDGKIISNVSFLDILANNGMRHMWEVRPYYDDPVHLNDIEPIYESGPYWERGDLLISSRFMGLMLYRPSTGKILWHREKPWSMQHDVNVVDGHRISVFDNNVIAAAGRKIMRPGATNRMLIYDFADDSVSNPFEAAYTRHQVKSVSEGRSRLLDNGDVFVEDTNYGRLIRMTTDGTMRWRYISADSNKKRFRLAWSRYLEPKLFEGAVQAAVNAKCS